MNEWTAFPPQGFQSGPTWKRHGKKWLPTFFVVLAGGLFLGGGASLCFGAPSVSENEHWRQRTEQDSTITTDSRSIFIGEDAETGDHVIRVTPPRQQPTQQPSIPYIIPEVGVPWPSGGEQGGLYPPGGENNGGLYPPLRPDRPAPPDSSVPGRPTSPPFGGNPGGLSPSSPPTHPYPGVRPNPQPGQPPDVKPGMPPQRPQRPDAGQPGRPGRPNRPPAWRPNRVPGQGGAPYAGGAFVYQPGRELPRHPVRDHPYAPLGPSGPIVLPPNRH